MLHFRTGKYEDYNGRSMSVDISHMLVLDGHPSVGLVLDVYLYKQGWSAKSTETAFSMKEEKNNVTCTLFLVSASGSTFLKKLQHLGWKKGLLQGFQNCLLQFGRLGIHAVLFSAVFKLLGWKDWSTSGRTDVFTWLKLKEDGKLSSQFCSQLKQRWWESAKRVRVSFWMCPNLVSFPFSSKFHTMLQKVVSWALGRMLPDSRWCF